MSPTPEFLTTRADQVHHIQARLAFLTDNAQARPALLRSVDGDRVELCRLDGTEHTPAAEDERDVLGGAGAAVQQQGVVGAAEQGCRLVHAAGRGTGDVVLGAHAGRGEARARRRRRAGPARTGRWPPPPPRTPVPPSSTGRLRPAPRCRR